MPIRINLYHEIERQKAKEARDPLKIAIAVIAFIALGCVVFYGYQLNVQRGLNAELARVTAEYENLKPKAEAAVQREQDLSVDIKASEALVRRIEGRFYWAPVLDRIAKLVPRDVQVTKFTGDVSGDSLKRCSITMEGISAGADPRKVAEDFRRAMNEKFSADYRNVVTSYKSLDELPQTVSLDGRALQSAAFSINIRLEIGEEPPPPPPPKRTPRNRS